MTDIGETIRFRSDLTDDANVLANAVSVILTVTLPDGTTVTPTVTNPPAVTGKYTANYLPTLPGRHVAEWAFTLGGGVIVKYVETTDVGAALITVDEAVAHLRAAGVITSASDLEQLQWLCLVATDAVENDLGRKLVKQTVVETHSAGSVLSLNWVPVVSVVSVTVDSIGLSEFTVNLRSGLVFPVARWFAGTAVVAYIAGYNDPPKVCRAVALNMVQSMWQESQQASHPLLDESTDLHMQDALSGLPEPLKNSYERLRVAGVA